MLDRKNETGRTVSVLGLSGSLRKGSFNTALLRAAQELAPAGMSISLYDLSPIPMYNEDMRADGFPPAAHDFREAVRQADAVLIASPEYNRSVPAVLKNAIDWASRRPDQPFARKAVAIMGVSNGAIGAAFANHHLRQILVYMDALMVNGPEVMVGRARERFDEEGQLVDEDTRKFVSDHLGRLRELVDMQRSYARERTPVR